jgi:hypothetical protein
MDLFKIKRRRTKEDQEFQRNQMKYLMLKLSPELKKKKSLLPLLRQLKSWHWIKIFSSHSALET